MKRMIVVLAFLLSAGIAFAGGGFEQEQRPWSEPQQTTKTTKSDDWTTGDKVAAVGVGVTAAGIATGLYLNYRRKKQ